MGNAGARWYRDGRSGRAAYEKGHIPGAVFIDLEGVALKSVTTGAERTPERAWLSQVPAVVLQQAVAYPNSAYRTFFQSVSAERKDSRVGHPRFRYRKDRLRPMKWWGFAMGIPR